VPFFYLAKKKLMELQPLTAISPIDGRYRNKAEELANYFSEFGLIKYRLLVEIEYFIALCELPLPQLEGFDDKYFDDLRIIYSEFDAQDALRVKEIESITNHDVKAVEYFIKEKMDDLGLSRFKEFVHFGLTSQDINNTATPMLLRDAQEKVLLPMLEALIEDIEILAREWAEIPMLARTHGQPASPTRLGKEMQVFAYRLRGQMEILQKQAFYGKFGGATGNFNAHHVAYPEKDWITFANNFLKNRLHLERSQFTTQIENYDMLAATFDALKRIHTILIDFSRDVWQYVSMNYFKQKIKEHEVGSSAMPHKVNPIDFENAEGNLGIANAILEHLASKLPVSRLQRDLTDSTVLRNIGVPYAHSLIAMAAIRKGLAKLELYPTAIAADLEANWAVVAEAIQTILRRENYPDPYETLKALTRTNEAIDEKSIRTFLNDLDMDKNLKKILLEIRPENYTGVTPEF